MSAAAARIGLEVHLQLSGKLFTTASEGDTTPFCFGLPGALPALQKARVLEGARFARALGAELAPWSAFERKHYTYPDLPKGYQITQQRHPLARGGVLPLTEGAIRIRSVHLEEDAASSRTAAGRLRVDCARSGVALLEVVTEPDATSGAHASAAFRELVNLARWAGLGPVVLAHGHARCDANVSVEGGARCEIKNLNSFRFVEQSVTAEVDRQRRSVEAGETIEPQTSGWDRKRRRTARMRTKTSREHYRFLPEPDLSAVLRPAVTAADLVPWTAREKLSALGLEPDAVELLVRRPEWGRPVLTFGSVALAKAVVQAPEHVRRHGPGADLTRLRALAKALAASHDQATSLFSEVITRGVPIEDAARQAPDSEQAAAIARAAITAAPDAAQSWRGGRPDAINALMGAARRIGAKDMKAVRAAMEALLLADGEPELGEASAGARLHDPVDGGEL